MMVFVEEQHSNQKYLNILSSLESGVFSDPFLLFQIYTFIVSNIIMCSISRSLPYVHCMLQVTHEHVYSGTSE